MTSPLVINEIRLSWWRHH